MGPTLHEPADHSGELFSQLLLSHSRHVHAYLFSLLGNWADADDLLQETGLRLWQQFDKFIPGTDFRVWARTIAYYAVLTFRKRQQRQKLIPFSEQVIAQMAADIESDEPPLDDYRDALAQCTRRLSERARQLLRLTYEERRPLSEVARDYGRSPQATRTALCRLRGALRECVTKHLQPRGDDDRADPDELLRAQVNDLTTGLTTGTLDARGANRLNTLLEEDPRARRLYLQFTYESVAIGLLVVGEAAATATMARADAVEEDEEEDAVYNLLPLDAWPPPNRSSDTSAEVIETLHEFPAPRHRRRHKHARTARWTRRRLLGLVAAMFVVVTLGGVVAFVSGLLKQSRWPAPVVAEVVGKVLLESVDSSVSACREGERLEPGSRLRPAANSSVLVAYDNGTRLRVNGIADFELLSETSGRSRTAEQWRLHTGRVDAEVKRSWGQAELVLSTANAEVTVRGTRLQLLTAGETTRVEVFEGHVGFVGEAGGALDVASAQQAILIGQGQPALAVSLFTRQTPEYLDNVDRISWELGQPFSTSVDGQVKAIRYYNAISETGSHVGHIWDAAGILLASVPFTNESGRGWQTATLSKPLNIVENRTYTVSVNCNTHYTGDLEGPATPFQNGVLSSAGIGTCGKIGLFPNSIHHTSHYYRDVIFVPNPFQLQASLRSRPLFGLISQ